MDRCICSSASSLSTGAAYTWGFGVPTDKNQEDSNLASVEAMQWVLSTYPSILIRVTENISHSTAKMCRSTIMHVQHSFRCNSQTKCFRTHVDMDIFSCFVMWNSCPKFIHNFQLHSVCNLQINFLSNAAKLSYVLFLESELRHWDTR
jgi:hypothetical protein